MPLACPNCAIDMHEVAAEATTGYRLVLDQCARCGGIWCDRWELFPLSATAAHRLDPVDSTALAAPFQPVAAPLTCPRCRARMAQFHDAALPPDAHIERCLNCDGMWFNRAELRRLKPMRPGRRVARTPGDTEVERLARAAQDPSSWPTVSNLDAAMQDPPPAEAEPLDVRREVFGGVAWMGLRALLRLLLHV